MNAAASLENVYHEIMLSECKNEESKDWENARHEIMAQSINDSCNYFGSHNCIHEDENEREKE